jgi:multidrug resistance efflux pump
MENNNQEKPNGTGKNRNRLMLLALIAFLVAGAVGLFYIHLASSQVYVENSNVEAPTINLSSAAGGSLQKMFVAAGDLVIANQPIAEVGNDIVKAKDAGTVISVNNDIGKNFTPGEAVATMIRPQDLRIDAQVEEDKGLNDVQVGQKVNFTVDAFGSKEYTGVVDQISPTSRSGDVVFNISDTRQENKFDVKIRYDLNKYPELKNGMSAKVWIYKN